MNITKLYLHGESRHNDCGIMPSIGSRFKYFEAPDEDMHHGRRTLSSTLSFPEYTRLNGRPSLSSKRTPLESQRFHHL